MIDVVRQHEYRIRRTKEEIELRCLCPFDFESVYIRPTYNS